MFLYSQATDNTVKNQIMDLKLYLMLKMFVCCDTSQSFNLSIDHNRFEEECIRLKPFMAETNCFFFYIAGFAHKEWVTPTDQAIKSPPHMLTSATGNVQQ
ncbi:hypothetical protein ACI65C_010659 [Semiaphis heraclei]